MAAPQLPLTAPLLRTHPGGELWVSQTAVLTDFVKLVAGESKETKAKLGGSQRKTLGNVKGQCCELFQGLSEQSHIHPIPLLSFTDLLREQPPG